MWSQGLVFRKGLVFWFRAPVQPFWSWVMNQRLCIFTLYWAPKWWKAFLPGVLALLTHTGRWELVPLRDLVFSWWNLLFIYVSNLGPMTNQPHSLSLNFPKLSFPLYRCLRVFACNFCLDDFSFCFKKTNQIRTCFLRLKPICCNLCS